jgi:hypothetical protein
MRYLLSLFVFSMILVLASVADAQQPTTKKKPAPTPAPATPAPAPATPAPKPAPPPPAPKPAPPAPAPVAPAPHVNPNATGFDRSQGHVLTSFGGGLQSSASPFSFVASRFPQAVSNPWNNPFPFVNPFVWQQPFYVPSYSVYPPPLYPSGMWGNPLYAQPTVWPGYYSPLAAMNPAYMTPYNAFGPGYGVPLGGFNNFGGFNGFGQPAIDHNNNDKPVVGKPFGANN